VSVVNPEVESVAWNDMYENDVTVSEQEKENALCWLRLRDIEIACDLIRNYEVIEKRKIETVDVGLDRWMEDVSSWRLWYQCLRPLLCLQPSCSCAPMPAQAFSKR
jgi:hypothetical protein